MNRELVWKALKEPLRLLVLAVIPLLVAYFSEVDYQWAALVVVVLRFVDKLLHEIGKQSKSDLLVKGLTRF